MSTPTSSIVFILISVTLASMGIGIIAPVMPDLIQSIDGGSVSDAAVWGGVLATAFAVMQFIFGPILGSLSDAYGRKPVLLISLAAMSGSYIIVGLAGSLWMLVLARMFSGMTSATNATAAAFMADISSREDRAKRFGLVGAAFGMGFVLGPVVGGVLGEISARAPFFASAGLAALNFVFGLIVMPESLAPENRRAFSWKSANTIGAIANVAKLPIVRRLLIVLVIYNIAFNVYPSVWSYFGKARFDWSPNMLGISLGVFGISIALVQAVLIRPALNRLGDRRTIITAFGIDIVTFTAIAFTTSGVWAIGLSPLVAVGAMANPAIQGMLSKYVGDSQQGELQGVVAAMNSLAMIVAPLVMTQTFYFFSSPSAPVNLVGAPFLLSAGLLIIALIVFMRGNYAVTCNAPPEEMRPQALEDGVPQRNL